MRVKALKRFIGQKNEGIKGDPMIPKDLVFEVPEGRGKKLIELGLCQKDIGKAPKSSKPKGRGKS